MTGTTIADAPAVDAQSGEYPTQLPRPDAGQRQLQSRADQVALAGVIGTKRDPTPESAYTLAGVTSGEPTPESDPAAAALAGSKKFW